MPTGPVPPAQGALVVADEQSQWAGRCRWADDRRIAFHILSFTPPPWPLGQRVQVRWVDDRGLWSAGVILTKADQGYAGRWAGRPERIETREAPRLPLAIRVDYGLVRPDATGLTQDVSLLGTAFLAGFRAKPGEMLHLVLRFPSPVSVRARVVRATPENGRWRIAVTWA
ncbi:MAG: PilZ domain-containing protein, partial [Clostridia bacterium]